jgi:hypothetical protein
MHGHAEVGIVAEDDPDRVPNLRPDQWTQDAQVLPLLRARLQLLKSGIRILLVDRLVIDDVPGSLACIVLRSLHVRNAGDVATLRRIVPIHLIGSNVVRTHHTGLGRRVPGGGSCGRVKLGGTGRARSVEQQHRDRSQHRG